MFGPLKYYLYNHVNIWMPIDDLIQLYSYANQFYKKKKMLRCYEGWRDMMMV